MVTMLQIDDVVAREGRLGEVLCLTLTAQVYFLRLQPQEGLESETETSEDSEQKVNQLTTTSQTQLAIGQ
jgi:hypothetical protein